MYMVCGQNVLPWITYVNLSFCVFVHCSWRNLLQNESSIAGAPLTWVLHLHEGMKWCNRALRVMGSPFKKQHLLFMPLKICGNLMAWFYLNTHTNVSIISQKINLLTIRWLSVMGHLRSNTVMTDLLWHVLAEELRLKMGGSAPFLHLCRNFEH